MISTRADRTRRRSELLARESEGGAGHRQMACRRAARAAFMWPVEASEMAKAGLRSGLDLVEQGRCVWGVLIRRHGLT